MLTSRSPIEHPEKLRNGDHLVQFYKDDRYLAEAVTNFVGPALMNGEAAVIVATADHLFQFEKNLRAIPLNTSLLRLTGQLVMLEAQTTLSKFMVNDMPDPDLFEEVIGKPIREIQTKFPHIKAYGEMVNLLWNEGNLYGTVALEKMWEQLMSETEFTLLCAYSMDTMCEEKEGIAFREVCKCHTHVIPAEGIIDAETSDEQLRRMAQLQFHHDSEMKSLKEWKTSTLELMIPLTAMKIHLRDLKSNSRPQDVSLLISKCENQIHRMNGIIDRLNK